jgi:hypothetical protein
MASISSMSNNTYLMYQLAEKKGLSLFGSSNTSDTSRTASDPLHKMWSDYAAGSTSSSTYEDDFNTLSHIHTGMNSLISSYNDTKKEFYAGYDASMSDLKTAAATLAHTDFAIGSTDAAAKGTTAAAGTKAAAGTSTTASTASSTGNAKLDAVIKNVTGFVNKYNDALSFFSDNKDVSSRVSALSTRFADTTSYHASSYAAFGLNVDKTTGKMSVDTTQLTKALQETPDTTAYVLGKDLAGRASDNVSLANVQRSSAFPSVNSALGKEMQTASIYTTGNTLANMNAYANVGNLLDMFF